MKPKTTWIVVADGARARIARNDGPGTGLMPAFDHEFAAPHAPTRSFVSDRPGLYADGRGPGMHRFAPRHDRHDMEKAKFAHDLAQVIDRAAEAHEFDRLVIIAPAGALGRLRAALDGRARRRIVAEIPKDLTHLKLHQLPPHIGTAVRL